MVSYAGIAWWVRCGSAGGIVLLVLLTSLGGGPALLHEGWGRTVPLLLLALLSLTEVAWSLSARRRAQRSPVTASPSPTTE